MKELRYELPKHQAKAIHGALLELGFNDLQSERGYVNWNDFEYLHLMESLEVFPDHGYRIEDGVIKINWEDAVQNIIKEYNLNITFEEFRERMVACSL